MRRDGLAAFGGVLLIIEADAGQINGCDRREGLAGLDDAIVGAEVAEDVAGDFARGAIGLERRVSGAAGGEVADKAHGGS